MENIINLLKKHASVILAVAFVLLFINNCSTNKEISKVNKEIDSLTFQMNDMNVQLKEYVNEEEMKKLLERNMYEFLIYEEDIDKGRLSLSEVKIQLSKLKPKEVK